MASSIIKIATSLMLATFCLMPIGCSELSATVNGKVYYDGKLMKVIEQQRGKVIFRAVNGGATCMGLIDKTGSYSISTGTTNALVPGDYLVSVSVVEIVQNEDENIAPEAKAITPMVYNDSLTSGLTCMVKRGKNVYDIQLKAIKYAALEEQEIIESDSVEDEQNEPATDSTSAEGDSLEDNEKIEKQKQETQTESTVNNAKNSESGKIEEKQ